MDGRDLCGGSTGCRICGIGSPAEALEAVATLTAAAPRLQWRLDAGIQPIIDTQQDYQREALAISKSNDIAQQAVKLLSSSAGLSGMTPEAVLSAVSVRTGNSNTLLVTATADDPQKAAELANAYVQAFVEIGQKLSGVSADLADSSRNFRSQRRTSTGPKKP